MVETEYVERRLRLDVDAIVDTKITVKGGFYNVSIVQIMAKFCVQNFAETRLLRGRY